MGFESENKVMVIGVLIHTLLQGVLKIKTANAQKIENMLDDILSTRSTVKMLHNISLKLEELKTELMEFIPRIVKFMEDYVLQRSNTKQVLSFNFLSLRRAYCIIFLREIIGTVVLMV